MNDRKFLVCALKFEFLSRGKILSLVFPFAL